jgi:hypothetical protein
MEALLETRPIGRRAQIDLVRGALDAWLHPPVPSHVPAVAALVGGGLWTVVAAAVVFQPAPPQWPGYIMEILGLALISAGFLLVATLGCALRAGDLGGRAMWLAIALTVGGYLAWIGALAATAAGIIDGPTLAAAQTVAMVGTALVGVVLARRGDEAVGLLLMVGPIAMLVPWTTSWLVLGAAWNAVGWVLTANRSPRRGTGTGWHAA